MSDRLQDLSFRAENLAFRSLLGVLGLLPYRARLALMGFVYARVIAPLVGHTGRIRANLAHVMPDLAEPEVRRLMRTVPDNVGRTLAELYSASDFKAAVANATIEGPGAAPLLAAQAEGRPVVVVSAHIGNYLAALVAFTRQGVSAQAIYNPMKNPYFQRHYLAAMSSFDAEMVGRDRKSFAHMLRHLKGGGVLAILNDQYMSHGAPLAFFGQTAPTALSAAELALKYDALLIPIYGLRQPDGVNFRIVTEAPIPHSDAETMTQAANDSLEVITRQNMDQWFWIHRRWKPGRQATMAAHAEALAAARRAKAAPPATDTEARHAASSGKDQG